ncbi:MAG: Adenosylhomocysteinase [uncultured Thermomicrobiales bacterium]|uniref:Adenosylhomocysteinase n=1 Tax=uncultured Thermomicrobiales bacterium TaxID=1645740 RepID=A0A6J4TVL9_9BACT|nr:MAG: Adenosylhomocysteinase [uncultured Thermomicrobiales bacterium]
MIDVLANPVSQASRDFAVAVFVIHDGRVLLHRHARLARWLPPGGHVEPGELPDDAATREVFEETGVIATLRGPSAISVDRPGQPRQLIRPAGIQLTDIAPGHQHIDLVYFATGQPATPRPGVSWFAAAELPALGLTDEIAAWCDAALSDASLRLSAAR